jgi:hypothetical protein
MNMETKQSRPDTILSWQAEEFYFHQKDFLWYLQAILAATAISILAWLISGGNDIISPIIIFVALLSLTVYASRKPKKKNFSLTPSRLKIDSQEFELFTFSRYWVETFDTHTQITLVGIKRTSMPVALYLTDKELTKKVLATLSLSLPQTNPSNNPADWIARKIKF